ncbi:hypothetical protein N9483_00015 [Flavobacteriaceae bacterium]|nr:hypothetical protein [Flavobacteriaceae bacterium]MDB4187300.1 hypothetical protein [Flavobacteriaceae bacterium]
MKQETINYLLERNVNYNVLRELGVQDHQLSEKQLDASKINSWFQ